MWGSWTEEASSHGTRFNVVGWEGYSDSKRMVMSMGRKEESNPILLPDANGAAIITNWMECNAENAKRSSIV